MGYLPADIVQVLAREPEEQAENYEHIKKLLLKRFKLSPEVFRQKFVHHQKKAEGTWRDFLFEAQNYLEEWLKGMEVDDFEALKDLMIADQMKKRVSGEVQEHFADEWTMIKSSSLLADMLDNYEMVRKPKKKPFEKWYRTEKPHPPIINKQSNKTGNTSRLNHTRKEHREEKNSRSRLPDMFERRRALKCFECNEPGHLRPQCPRLAKQRSEKVEPVNHVKERDINPFLDPYVKPGLVNGIEIEFLRDSGSTIDLVSRRYVKPEFYCGENIWVKQPLDEHYISLPLAIVEISGEFGKVRTRAAVFADSLDQGRYILGNRTAALIEEKKTGELTGFEPINAVQTRSQTRAVEKEIAEKESDSSEIIVEENGFNKTENAFQLEPDTEVIKIPDLNNESAELTLLEINREEFKKAQHDSSELKGLFEIAANQNSTSEKNRYRIEDEILVKIQNDRLGNIKKLLVIPEGLREGIKSLCHEGTSAHLGSTKTKDKLSRYFYWPGCYQDIEQYVRTCDECQRAGKPNDKKKAPLKLVPVIQEVFSKINIDACGPLPETPKGNRYLITAICLTSKYPEAIPVADINSVSVTDALLNIFSRIGFPREVQTDQGTSFTSALTSEFFERFGIKICHSSVYHPQSNPVERFHRTVKRLLRALCLEAGEVWEKNLPSALLALRTVTHESIGFSPSELVFGKNLRTPETLLYEKWFEPEEVESPVTEYVFQLINRLKRCQEVAVKQMEELQVKRKKWYDKNAVKREFKEGDLVLVLATGRGNKFGIQWMGPGTIQNKISETNYAVEIPGKRERSQIYHINMLKRYHKRPEAVNLVELEMWDATQIDNDLDFPFIETNPNIYDFQEITESSALSERLEPDQIDQLRQLLGKYSTSFSNEPGLTNLVTHDIQLINDKPVRSKPYRSSHRQNEILKTEVQRMLDLKIVEVGESDYTSPMILVEAPGKDPRPCVDYRRLNEVTRTEFSPLPNIEERVERVAGALYITVLDFAKGYWQIPLSENAQRLAAFFTSFGTYRPLRMSFGLKNAPYFFSRLMAELLGGCEEFAVPYLDDIAIFSETWEGHLKHLGRVLELIAKGKLTIKPTKCKFAQDHVKYLGHVVGNGFRSPTEAKIQSIQAFPTPKTKTQVRAFLGLVGYYSRYIPLYSVIAAPLTDTLKGKAKRGDIDWTEACEEAFQELKGKLIDKPVLYSPNFNREFIVQTDSSDMGMGVVLSQLNENKEEHPILYLSKKFSNVERKYCTTEKECASIIFAIKRLHYYLDGQNFTIMTDHNPLVWLKSNASSNPRLMRWALALQPYNFKIIHRPGKNHQNADSLSRLVVVD
ncbi:Retrovirus-related Pol polyprotein from transposon 17.6 [Araneus ventricosus]|uniref:RNA-directed DNA polymerase n=4 Tax=Araneus ventricosus TaxID=182803 RepID=A0A4Y2CJ38_ARAVE|nr:Retrovirus-related Pol polyprotein from transposon 17.6 [Araneus ventricosus]GBM03944.1 Retrovirus-related Pol polyprotein from transposon 17.6 [Araneus ventricosus]